MIADYNRALDPLEKFGLVAQRRSKGEACRRSCDAIGSLRSPTERPALWLIAIASAFFAYFFLLLYCDLVRPVNPGFIAGPTPAGHVVVTSVVPDTPAAAAGIQAGDRILSFAGATIVSPDAWSVLGTAAERKGLLPVVVERNGREVRLTIALRAGSRQLLAWQGRLHLVDRTDCAVCSPARRRLHPLAAANQPSGSDRVMVSHDVRGFYDRAPLAPRDGLAQSTVGLGLLMFLPYTSGLTIGPVLLTFVAAFPRRLPYAGYVQAATWVVGALALAVPLSNFVNLVYGGGELGSMGPGTRPLFLLTVVSLAPPR